MSRTTVLYTRRGNDRGTASYMFEISIENSTALRSLYVPPRAPKVYYLVIDIGYINLHIIRPAK